MTSMEYVIRIEDLEEELLELRTFIKKLVALLEETGLI